MGLVVAIVSSLPVETVLRVNQQLVDEGSHASLYAFTGFWIKAGKNGFTVGLSRNSQEIVARIFRRVEELYEGISPLKKVLAEGRVPPGVRL
jgi:uncharacterized protein YaaQ